MKRIFDWNLLHAIFRFTITEIISKEILLIGPKKTPYKYGGDGQTSLLTFSFSLGFRILFPTLVWENNQRNYRITSFLAESPHQSHEFVIKPDAEQWCITNGESHCQTDSVSGGIYIPKPKQRAMHLSTGGGISKALAMPRLRSSSTRSVLQRIFILPRSHISSNTSSSSNTSPLRSSSPSKLPDPGWKLSAEVFSTERLWEAFNGSTLFCRWINSNVLHQPSSSSAQHVWNNVHWILMFVYDHNIWRQF